MKQKQVLVILDGWGIAETWGGNAISLAETPVMDRIRAKYPYNILAAAGEAVGLPYNEPGNSEVGHLNIGTGQSVGQGLTAINEMISDKSFFYNAVLNKLMEEAKKNNKTIHLMGLLSDGGIHSHINHLLALIDLAKTNEINKLFIHAFTDGRDSSPTSGIEFVKKLQEKLASTGVGKIATISGRYYAMDRDKHWDRIEKVYETIVSGKGKTAGSGEEAVRNSYEDGVTDEFIIPTVIDKHGAIKDGDEVIFFNFRSDRARMLSQALVSDNFSGFKREDWPKNIHLATFASYQEDLKAKVVFGDKKVGGQLAKLLENKGMNQFHIAETEKYAHVTYFFNGGVEKPFAGEERILVPSPKVATYDLKPEMSASLIADEVVKKIDDFPFTVINFANADMVGHTGNMDATIKAVEAADKALGKVINHVILQKYSAMVIADHGNAEQMINPLNGLPDTEHTNNPVPVVLVNDQLKTKKIRDGGRLCDVSPTICELLEIEKSDEMIGSSLLI